MHRTTLADLIAAGYLDAGERLTATYRGREVRARVLEDGRLRVGRRVYPTPSAAASAAIEQVRGTPRAANGWEWWTAPSGRELDEIRAAYLSESVAA